MVTVPKWSFFIGWFCFGWTVTDIITLIVKASM